MRRSMRLAIGGCVEKRFEKSPRLSRGWTINRCAVEGEPTAMGRRFE